MCAVSPMAVHAPRLRLCSTSRSVASTVALRLLAVYVPPESGGELSVNRSPVRLTRSGSRVSLLTDIQYPATFTHFHQVRTDLLLRSAILNGSTI